MNPGKIFGKSLKTMGKSWENPWRSRGNHVKIWENGFAWVFTYVKKR